VYFLVKNIVRIIRHPVPSTHQDRKFTTNLISDRGPTCSASTLHDKTETKPEFDEILGAEPSHQPLSLEKTESSNTSRIHDAENVANISSNLGFESTLTINLTKPVIENGNAEPINNNSEQETIESKYSSISTQHMSQMAINYRLELEKVFACPPMINHPESDLRQVTNCETFPASIDFGAKPRPRQFQNVEKYKGVVLYLILIC